jgi:hypothetical protein
MRRLLSLLHMLFLLRLPLLQLLGLLLMPLLHLLHSFGRSILVLHLLVLLLLPRLQLLALLLLPVIKLFLLMLILLIELRVASIRLVGVLYRWEFVGMYGRAGVHRTWLRSTIGRRMIFTSRRSRRHNAIPMKLSRPRRGRNRGAPMILICT